MLRENMIHPVGAAQIALVVLSRCFLATLDQDYFRKKNNLWHRMVLSLKTDLRAAS